MPTCPFHEPGEHPLVLFLCNRPTTQFLQTDAANSRLMTSRTIWNFLWTFTSFVLFFYQ